MGEGLCNQGGVFQLVVLSGKTPGRVLNFKKKPGEGFIQGRVFPTATAQLYSTGCQVGGHVQKGGKEDIFTRKGGQKEDIFY